jgi:hypothetical protein
MTSLDEMHQPPGNNRLMNQSLGQVAIVVRDYDEARPWQYL